MGQPDESAALRREADQILDGMGLRAALCEFGSPHVTGSYALDLMTWRDLDLYLEAEVMSERRFFELGGRIASILMPVKMNFRNERVARTPDLPREGLYWGTYFELAPGQSWKMDLWCVDTEECRRLLEHCSSIEERLTPGSRETILEIKAAVCSHPQYRRGFTSQDVYQAVLDDGIRTIEQFRACMRQRGFEI
jgi:hypothetical protein